MQGSHNQEEFGNFFRKDCEFFDAFEKVVNMAVLVENIISLVHRP
jgi:hypothetical protein